MRFSFFHWEDATCKIQGFFYLNSFPIHIECVPTFAFIVHFPLISSRKGVKLKLSTLEIMLFHIRDLVTGAEIQRLFKGIRILLLHGDKDDWHIAWLLGVEIKCLLLLYFRSPGESLNQRGDSAACVSIAPHLYFTGQSFDSVGNQEVKHFVLAIRMKAKFARNGTDG